MAEPLLNPPTKFHGACVKERSDAGYSLVELMVVMCLIGILGGMTVFQYLSARPGMQADGAMRVVMAELNAARETAVAQRREVEVAFVGDKGIMVTRIDDTAPDPDLTTMLRNVSFEASLQFGTNPDAGDTKGTVDLTMLPNDRLDPLFAAAVQCVEEAVVNAMIAADTMTGANGRTVRALPHGELQRILRKYGRLVDGAPQTIGR